MISWPDAAASISGVNPNTGSLQKKKKKKGKGYAKLVVLDVPGGVCVCLT